MSAHRELFEHLQTPQELLGLIGKTEHLHLECKTWSANDNDAQKTIAKAICGFANADGGVLVIGLATTKSADKYTPDVIDAAVPVTDAISLKARIESVIPEIVEPVPSNVRVVACSENGAASGYVVIDVPATDGPPCRSRKDWRFYQRINSGTYLMEYFQIEDMFGKRHRPALALVLAVGDKQRQTEYYQRDVMIGIQNQGRAIAKFPGIRFRVPDKMQMDNYGLDGNRNFGLPRRPTGSEVVMFGGGADEVIYPGSILNVLKLNQRSRLSEWLRPGGIRPHVLDGCSITVELLADNMPIIEQTAIIPPVEGLT